MNNGKDQSDKKPKTPIKVSFDNHNIIPFLNNLTQTSDKDSLLSHINKSNLHDPGLIQHGIDSNDKLPNSTSKLNIKGNHQEIVRASSRERV